MKKNLLLRLCLILFTVFYLQSCRNDYFEQNYHPTPKSPSSLQLVKLSQIPQIAAFIKKKSGREDFSLSLKNLSASGKSSETADFSLLQIETQTIVSVQRNNSVYYVFRISGEDSQNGTTFYNLEVKESNGTPVNAQIIEYRSDVPFSQEPLVDIQSFSGTVSTYSLTGEAQSRFSLDDGTGECPPNSNQPPEDGGSNGNEPIDPNTGYPGIPGEWEPGNGGGGGDTPSNPDDCWQIVRVPTQPWRTLGWENACTGEWIDNPADDGNTEGMKTGILNSGCGDGSGTVIIPGEEDDPCEVLQQNSADPKFQSKLDSIKTRVLSTTPDRDTLETQMVVDKADGQTYYNIYSNTSSGGGLTNVTGEVNQFTVATAHNHPQNSIPIFSYADIASMYDVYKFLPPSKRKVYKEYLVSYNNTTYALQINDLSYLDTLFAGINLGTMSTTEADKEKAVARMKKIYDRYGIVANHTFTQAEAEQKFLKALFDNDIGSGNSIHLYRKDADGWGKLNIDANGNITKENCP